MNMVEDTGGNPQRPQVLCIVPSHSFSFSDINFLLSAFKPSRVLRSCKQRREKKSKRGVESGCLKND